ncbi:MAG TPA: MFS transporter [Clostridiales bacterium]|nr:MFS transporter [Clostridiales bacterium]
MRSLPAGQARFVMRARMRFQLAALATVPFIMVLGNSMLIPILPQIANQLNLGQAQVGLLITAFSLPAGLTMPWAGLLSDRVGRIRVIAPALVVFGVGGLAAGLATILAERPFPLMLGARVLQGVGAGGTYQLALALAGDIFQTSERSKVLGILESANGLGKVVSPLAGAAVALVFWSAPFFVYGGLAIPAAALVWLAVREPGRSGKVRPFREYARTLKRVSRRKALPLAACFLAGMVCLLLLFGMLANFSDVLAQQFGVAGFARGLIIAIPVFGLALTAFLSGTMLQRRGGGRARGAVLAGVAMATLGGVPLPWLGSVASWAASITLAGVGVGLALPALNTLVTSSVPYAGRGLLTALYGSMRFLGVAVGPPLFGMVEAWGALPVYLGGAAVGGVAFVVARGFLDQAKLLQE